MISHQKFRNRESVDLTAEKPGFQVHFLIMFILAVFPMLPAENPDTSINPEITSYYYLKNRQLQNFSCFISTDKFRQFQENLGDTSRTYPLKVVWTRNGKLYYILQPFDDQDGAMNQQKSIEEVLQVRQQFQEFYDDWDFFLISPPQADLPDSLEYVQSGDTTLIKYVPEFSEEGEEITLKLNMNGILIARQERFAQEKIVTRPLYQSREEGPVCDGWDSELFFNDSLIEKSTVRLIFFQNMPYPVPSRADIETVFDKDSSTQKTVLYFHHYEFNLPLQELEVPDSLK